MTATIYYDNLGSRSAAISDGTIDNSSNPGAFTNNLGSDELDNELRAIDGNITDVIGGWAVNEGLKMLLMKSFLHHGKILQLINGVNK